MPGGDSPSTRLSVNVCCLGFRCRLVAAVGGLVSCLLLAGTVSGRVRLRDCRQALTQQQVRTNSGTSTTEPPIATNTTTPRPGRLGGWSDAVVAGLDCVVAGWGTVLRVAVM